MLSETPYHRIFLFLLSCLSFPVISQVTEVLPLTLPPFYITTDYNLDGQEELVYTDADTVFIVTRQGFTTTPLHEFVVENPGNIRAGDMNGDGFPELTLVNSNQVRFLENNNGVPGQVNLIEASISSDYQWTEIFDFDLDGDGDLLQNHHDIAIYVIENVNGTFLTDEKMFITNTNKDGGKTEALFCDINQDGFMDPLLYQVYTGLVLIYNQGDGNFEVSTQYSVPYPAGLDSDDYNGDGFPDLFQLHRGFGQQDSLRLRVTTNPYGASPDFHFKSLNGLPNALDAIDVNQDMIPDVIIADQHSVSVLYSNQDQYEYQLIWGEPDTIDFTHPLPLVKLDVIDLDGDGLLEIIHVDKDGQGRILKTDWMSSGPEYSCQTIPDPLDCPPGDVTLTSQSEVDQFRILYPDCTVLNGGLSLTGNITDLAPLHNIVTIGGPLSIQQTLLESIEDWALFFVHGGLTIRENPLLDHIELDKLYSVDGHVEIQNNIFLDKISCAKLYAIEGRLFLADQPWIKVIYSFEELTAVQSIDILHNEQLRSIHGFSSDYLSARRINLVGNPQLDTVKAFSAYHVGLTMTIDGCPVRSFELHGSIDTLRVRNTWMNSLSAFHQVGPLYFILENIAGLTSLTGLDTFGSYDFTIISCPDLKRLAPSLTLRNLDLRHNPMLEDLSGFTLPFGGMQNLKLIDNASLITLQSLPVLSRISKSLHIEGNTALESIGSLEVTNILVLDSLIIVNNPQLGICDAAPVCTYIEQYDTYRLENNASGCQSYVQVETACNNVPPFNPPIGTDDAKHEPYPNPADGMIWVPSDDVPQSLRLYDNAGRLIEEMVNEKEMDVSPFPNGFYTLVISHVSRKETVKVCIAR